MFQAQNQTLRIQQKPDREFPGLLALLSYRKETDVANKQITRGGGVVLSNTHKIKQGKKQKIGVRQDMYLR